MLELLTLLAAQTATDGTPTGMVPLAATGGVAGAAGYLIKLAIDRFSTSQNAARRIANPPVKCGYSPDLCAERHRALNSELAAIRDRYAQELADLKLRNAKLDGKLDKMNEVLVETKTLVMVLVKTDYDNKKDGQL